MSFDFSDLVIEDDNECYNYDNFLSDAIYDWLKEPENVLNACDAIEEKQQQQAKPKEKIYNYSTSTTPKYRLLEKSFISSRSIQKKTKKELSYKNSYFDSV